MVKPGYMVPTTESKIVLFPVCFSCTRACIIIFLQEFRLSNQVNNNTNTMYNSLILYSANVPIRAPFVITHVLHIIFH